MSLQREVHGRDAVVRLHDDGRATWQGLSVAAPNVVDCTMSGTRYALLCEDGAVYYCIGRGTYLLPIGTPARSIAFSSACLAIALTTGRVLLRSPTKWYTVPLPAKARRVFGGYGASAAICDDGGLYTWGHNHCQQLGHGGVPPARVALPDAVADFGFGAGFACALLVSGKLYVWGFMSSSRPRAFMRHVSFTRLAVGEGYISALACDGSVYMRGTISGIECSCIKTVPENVSGLCGGFASTTVRCEYTEEPTPGPGGAPPLNLRPRRWRARRLVVQWLLREESVRKRPRRCADGDFCHLLQLPVELWRAIVKYL